MRIATFRQHLLAGLAGTAFVIGGITSALADQVILNPEAPNTGCGTCTALSPIAPSFHTSSGQLNFTSDLIIQSAPGVGANVTATENGAFLITNFAAPSSGNVVTDYNIYATFSITGKGTWANSTTFQLTSITSDLITVIGNPGNGLGPVGAPTFGQATQASTGVTSHNAADFTLALSQIIGTVGIPGATFTGTGQQVGNGISIGVILALLPTPGTTGPTGFWQNVIPSGLNLSVTNTDSASFTEVNGTTPGSGVDGCTVAECTDLATTFGGTQSSNGSITFAVPEPASLSLLGVGLIGMAAMFRRRKRRNIAI